MKLSDVQRIATEVARQQDERLQVEGAIPAAAESGYTEVILTIRGCEDDPCMLVIGISRDASESSLRAAVAERLREHLRRHAAPNVTSRRSR